MRTYSLFRFCIVMISVKTPQNTISNDIRSINVNPSFSLK
jgi:hypothetical protein